MDKLEIKKYLEEVFAALADEKNRTQGANISKRLYLKACLDAVCMTQDLIDSHGSLNEKQTSPLGLTLEMFETEILPVLREAENNYIFLNYLAKYKNIYAPTNPGRDERLKKIIETIEAALKPPTSAQK